MATEIYQSLLPKSEYFDRTRKLTPEEYFKRLAESTTLYVGNLSIYTKEEAIYDLFSRCGQIKLFKMGLNKLNNTPCGFCFIEYYTKEEAEYAVDCLSHTHLDDRIIRVDWDIGFEEGRQYGRGKSGGQVRDDHRSYEDPGRGELKNKGDYQHRGERGDRGGDRRDRRHNNYSGRGDFRDRNRFRGDNRNESSYRQQHDSDSEGEDNYRRKKTKGN